MNAAEVLAQWGSATFLVSIRLGAALFYTPWMRTFSVPQIARLGLLIALSIAISHSLLPIATLPTNASSLFVAALGEVMVGLVLALGVRCVFAALEFAGRIVEAQAGLSLSTFFNPASGQQDSTLGAAFSMAGLVFFMAIDGHYAVLRTFAATYALVPISGAWSGDLVVLSQYFGKMFFFGFALAAVVVITLWFVDVALAILLRSMPQFNVLFLSFPLKLLLTLTLLAMIVPHLGPAFVTLLKALKSYWIGVLIGHG